MVKRWLTLHLSEPQFLPVSPLSQLPRYWKDGDNLGLFLVPSIAQVRTVFDSLEAFGSLLWSERPWCPVCKARLCLRICGPPCCVHLPQGSPPHEARHPPARLPNPCHRRLNAATACSSISYLQSSSRHGPQLVLELEHQSWGHPGSLGGLNKGDLKLAAAK